MESNSQGTNNKARVTPSIVCNRIRCLDCGDIIESRYRHDYVSCGCGSCAVDGGYSYLKRVGSAWEDMSVYVDDGHDKVREVFERGSFGKNGDQPLHYVPLKDMTDEHLENTINYCKHHNDTLFLSVYEGEVGYRKENGIAVQELSVK